MAPIENQVCRHCGEPAIEGRVELDGSVAYLCEKHIGMNGKPSGPGDTGTPRPDETPQS